MKRHIGFAVGILVISGCAVSGKYRSEGSCQGFHTDPAACERAYANGLVAGKIQIGQTHSEVRAIMGRDPERREATTEFDSWSYLTDYSNQGLTVIVFKQGVVAEIRQASVP
jgi:hypothetical protein